MLTNKCRSIWIHLVIRLFQCDLEKQCKEYNTKITDLEVSYETLEKKFKNRERELLSLLEDRVLKKAETGEYLKIL